MIHSIETGDDVDWLLKVAFDFSDTSMIYASASTGSKSGNFNGIGGAPEDREFDDEDTTSYELGVKSTLLDSRLASQCGSVLYGRCRITSTRTRTR